MKNNLSKTLIIMLNWNGDRDTIEALKSLSNCSMQKGFFDVLVIDNDSRLSGDELGVYINKKFEKINEITSSILEENNFYEKKQYTFISYESSLVFCKSDVNHGFAKGCNIGAKYARENSYGKILLLNNDTEVNSNFLDLMLDSLPNADCVIPQIRFYDRKNIIWNCGGKISKTGKRRYFLANENASKIDCFPNEFHVTFSTGCCILFTTKFFFDMGLFTEDFFFGEEDIDFSLKALSKRKKMICVKNSIIYHKVGASLTGDSIRAINKSYVHYLNRFINMKNHLGYTWWFWLIPSLCRVFINNKTISKLPYLENFRFLSYLVSDSISLHTVSKSKFESILHSGYPGTQ